MSLKMIIGERLVKLLHMIVVVLLVLCMKMKPAPGLFTSGGGDDAKEVRSSCIERERQALLQFKHGLIDDYGILSSWGSAEEEEKKDCCKWRGVRCSNRTGHVMVLDIHSSPGFDYQPLREITPPYDSVDYIDSALFIWKGQVAEYSNTLGLVKGIDLSCNKLAGKIPEEISSLAELIFLNLSRNNLTGTIFQKIGELKMLESLDLSENKLSGEIPTGLARLNYLSVLDLSYNNLSGKIPSSTQLQSFDAAYIGNQELCGLPLPNKCPGDDIDVVDPSIDNHQKDHHVQRDEDSFITPEFYISMGLGFGVGFGGVFGTLLLKSTWRYAYFKFLNNIKDWLYVATVVNMARLQRRLQS